MARSRTIKTIVVCVTGVLIWSACSNLSTRSSKHRATSIQNVCVYNEPGRFAGWPANNGIWNWGDEIVVGFTLGYFKDSGSGHPIDRDRPSHPMQARSLDGGVTWTIERPSYLTPENNHPELMDCLGGIDFTQPNFAMMFRMEHSNSGYSFFYWSNDRCRTWNGPYRLPTFDRKGVFARTDYLVNGKHDMMAFLTAAEDGGGEGWPFGAHTTDGGKTWEFMSWIGPQPEPEGYAIMPTTVRLSESDLLTVIRCRGLNRAGKKAWWIEMYDSKDNGASWQSRKDSIVDNGGNPGHMIRLRDGRIVLTYGWRHSPYGIRTRISDDNGLSFGKEIVLRDDGGVWDLGYVRSVQRADGKLVSVYYYNDKTQVERYIAATIWDASNP